MEGTKIALVDLWVEECPFKEAAAFVVAHHYTHSVKGMTPKHCFKVIHKDTKEVLGAAIFGIPGQVQTTNKYGDNGKVSLVELRRLVLLEEAPKNSETKVLGAMLRELRKLSIQRVLSYADPNEKRDNHPDGKHTGLIYRAAGFHLVKEAGKTKAIWWKGRRYPIRNIDQYNNYHTEPDGIKVGRVPWSSIPDEKKIVRWEKYKGGRRKVYVPKIAEERIAVNKQLRAALDSGEATFVREEGKIGYVKDLLPGMPYSETPRKNERKILK
jgi:hypothetical protein